MTHPAGGRRRRDTHRGGSAGPIRRRLGCGPLALHRRHERRQADVEGIGQESDVHEADVALAALDPADVRAMEPGAFGERLLAQPLSYSQLANRSTEGGREDLGVRAWHTPTLCTEMTMSLQTMCIIKGNGGGGLRKARQSGRGVGGPVRLARLTRTPPDGPRGRRWRCPTVGPGPEKEAARWRGLLQC